MSWEKKEEGRRQRREFFLFCCAHAFTFDKEITLSHDVRRSTPFDQMMHVEKSRDVGRRGLEVGWG